MASATLVGRWKNAWWWVVCLLVIAQTSFVLWASARPENHQVWERIITYPMWPPYADLRAMTAGWDEVAAGRDPLRTGAGAPLYNYPRLWLTGAKLGLRGGQWPGLGTALVIGFGLAVALTAAQAPRWSSVLFPGILVSTPIMLGLERGNIDILIFCLLTAVLVMPLASTRPFVGASAAVLLAAMLKYYPAVCFCALLRGADRTRRLIVMASMIAFLGVLVWTRADVRVILEKTDYGTRESYGAKLAADKLQGLWQHYPSYTKLAPAWVKSSEWRGRAIQGVAIFLLGIGALTVWWRPLRSFSIQTPAVSPPAARLYLAGATIYCATFVLGINWAYRLIFLLWTLPGLGGLLQSPRWTDKGWSAATLILMYIACWQVADRSDFEAPWGHLASLLLLLPMGLIAAALLRNPAPAVITHHSPVGIGV